jgi:Putative adhesin
MISTDPWAWWRACLPVVAALLCSREACAATHSVDQRQPADPAGTVEIVDVAGSVLVSGWDRPEVAVTGLVGDRVDRVELSSSGNRTTVHVIVPDGGHWRGDSAASLNIHVPSHSGLNVSLVSADLTLSGVSGPQQVRTVSGDIKSDGGGAARINTVSGNVHLSVPDSTAAEIETMSGDLTISGAGGDVSITTVSGDGHLTLGTVRGFRLRTVSGDFSIGARLDPAANFEAESISGNVHVDFSGAPAAQFDAQSLSGDIRNCKGPDATKAQHGPGTRLSFATGDGKAQVRLSSNSGDLGLCVK